MEYLDDGVVPDADENDDDVEHGQSQQQWAEVGSHLRLPGNVNLKFDFWAFINSIFSIFLNFKWNSKLLNWLLSNKLKFNFDKFEYFEIKKRFTYLDPTQSFSCRTNKSKNSNWHEYENIVM